MRYSSKIQDKPYGTVSATEKEGTVYIVIPLTALYCPLSAVAEQLEKEASEKKKKGAVKKLRVQKVHRQRGASHEVSEERNSYAD